MCVVLCDDIGVDRKEIKLDAKCKWDQGSHQKDKQEWYDIVEYWTRMKRQGP